MKRWRRRPPSGSLQRTKGSGSETTGCGALTSVISRVDGLIEVKVWKRVSTFED